MNDAEPTALDADAKAAHAFLTELRSRIAIQPLAFQDGDEGRALESLAELFGHARAAIRANPGCAEFAAQAMDLLNGTIRPVTAKWHPKALAGTLGTLDGASEFRGDLAAIRPAIWHAAHTFHEMAYGTPFPDRETPPAIPPETLAALFADLQFGLHEDRFIGAEDAAAINRDEATEIAARRETPDEPITNAVGLALSGGGIRSASFCLGACQALADCGLLEDVDIMSTVSGGGYAGAFVSLQMAARPDDPTAALRQGDKPVDPTADGFLKLRARIKYLVPSGFAERWSMICSLLAGMVLNWVVPAAVLSAIVLGAVISSTALASVMSHVWGGAVGIGVMAICIYAVLLRRDPDKAIRRFSMLAAVATGLIALALLPRLYDLYRAAIDPALAPGAALAAALAAGLPPAVRAFGVVGPAVVGRVLTQAALALAAVAVPVVALLFAFMLWDLSQGRIDPLGLHGVLAQAIPAEWTGAALIAAIALGLGLLATTTVDVNLTAPGRLYRDRLARSFVATSNNENGFVALDETNLLAEGPGKAPYHLINATLNLPTSRSPMLRERRGDFFVMSKHWSGSPSTGYARTERWRTRRGKLDLATAIAVSGAAVAPHMSLMTIPSLTALLAFLNLRLAFWLRKPRERPDQPARGTRPGAMALLREMLTVGLDEKRDWLLLSDGAHLDNSGIYELLRRRCKFIIACDVSADETNRFDTLITGLRHAEIDFGIRTTLRLDDLRYDTVSRTSSAHATLCEIRYPNGGRGLLLVLKSSVTGDEKEFIRTYREANPDFPNQSTLDQTFDEQQFEAYRQLGVHIVDGLFLPSLVGGDVPPRTVAEWMRRLAENLLPREVKDDLGT